MRPVFANTAEIDVAARLVLKGGRGRLVLKVRAGLIRHPEHGPVLIDTGYGPRVTEADGRSFALRAYARIIGPRLLADGSPKALLARCGYGVEDVSRIILTHLHADHVGTLGDFPNARILGDEAAFLQVLKQKNISNLRHGVFVELLPEDLAARVEDTAALATVDLPLGLGLGRDLLGDGSVCAVALPGHLEGHFGVCFPKLDPPLLYATDAAWMVAAFDPARAPGFPTTLAAADGQAARDSAARVQAFRAAGGAVLTCHDPETSPFDLDV